MDYSRAKGVYDSYPDSGWKSSFYWQWMEETLRKTAKSFGFQELRTPIFEKTELFVRCVGETSDIVSKEMYTFLDKGDRSMTLRPEGTAPAVRAYIENNLEQNKKAQKLFYIGPFFRYDRPQAGRYRQFHQLGAEIVGVKDPLQDVETIDFLLECYRKLGLKELTVLVNCIGDFAARERYAKELRNYLAPHKAKLSKDSQHRFEHNPLRILDSKDATDRELLEHAPKMIDLLNQESADYFAYILNQLEKIGISYKIDHCLVRGLDYYNDTVFEITSNVLGAQNTIGGGGRYDSLIRMLGGPDLPAVGFATGLERILQTLEGQGLLPAQTTDIFAYFIPLDDNAKSFAYTLLRALRDKDIPSDIYLRGKKLQKGLQFANDLQVKKTIIIGDEEMHLGKLKIKDMKTGTEQIVAVDDLIGTLHKLWRNDA
ncbi:MAG: histidine--tRNA ligase [Chlamydiales bacterium]|nr:histidine--tRNA ligase [Chlamydiales bacterium]